MMGLRTEPGGTWSCAGTAFEASCFILKIFSLLFGIPSGRTTGKTYNY